MFLNFYADWCRFSGLLQPIFEEAANRVSKSSINPTCQHLHTSLWQTHIFPRHQIHDLYPETGQVVMGKVDCDAETSISSRFQISKYPTLKLIVNGQPAKREYRGARTADAFVEFIKKQLSDPIIEVHALRDLEKLDAKQRIIVGYFDRRDQPEYQTFKRVALNLKDDCKFYAGFGEPVAQMHPPGTPIVVFRPDTDLSHANDQTFDGSLGSIDELSIWTQQKCVPLVREITFDNAEELTEEGLPFLILFHSADDLDSVKDYKLIVEQQLIGEKRECCFPYIRELLSIFRNDPAYSLHALDWNTDVLSPNVTIVQSKKGKP